MGLVSCGYSISLIFRLTVWSGHVVSVTLLTGCDVEGGGRGWSRENEGREEGNVLGWESTRSHTHLYIQGRDQIKIFKANIR